MNIFSLKDLCAAIEANYGKAVVITKSGDIYLNSIFIQINGEYVEEFRKHFIPAFVPAYKKCVVESISVDNLQSLSGVVLLERV